MFDLTKQERAVVIFLASGLILGLGVIAYRRTHSGIDLKISDYNIEDIKNIDERIDNARLVNINEAGIIDLMKLKGVGRILAERIIDYRSQKGPFKSKDQINNVKGIGKKLFDGLKDDIVVE